MKSPDSLLYRLQRLLTYPLAVSLARWLAVLQVLFAPVATPVPTWFWIVLVIYAATGTAISFPSMRVRQALERRDELARGATFALIALDVFAAAAVMWLSGVNSLPLLVGLDVATLPVTTTLPLLLAGTAAVTAAAFFSGGKLSAAAVAAAFGVTLGLMLVPYVGAGYGIAARRRAEEQIRAINAVLDAGSEMGTRLALPDVLSHMINMLRRFQDAVPWQNVVVYITRFDDDKNEDVLNVEAVAGAFAEFYHGTKIRFGEGVVGRAAMEQRPLLIPDLQKDSREAAMPKPKAVRGTLAVPILGEGQTIGCVHLMSAIPNAYTFDQQRLVNRLVRLASVGVQNARLHTKTLELAETDSMTGLLSNRAYQVRLEDEFKRAQSGKRSLSLLILDVDFFKHVNDTYGHPQGDELLKQLGVVLRKHGRKSDVCCRYGGDEFVMLMPETIKAEAASVAERVRKTVEETWFQLEDATARITVSGGVASYPQDVSTKQALVKASDAALYAAKQGGRNNVKLAGPTVTMAPPRPTVPQSQAPAS